MQEIEQIQEAHKKSEIGLSRVDSSSRMQPSSAVLHHGAFISSKEKHQIIFQKKSFRYNIFGSKKGTLSQTFQTNRNNLHKTPV